MTQNLVGNKQTSGFWFPIHGSEMTPHKFLQGNRETETQIQSLKRKTLKILFELNLVSFGSQFSLKR